MSASISCVPIQVAKRFIKECIAAAGGTTSHATDMADLLVAADHRGHFSHGLNRRGKFLARLLVACVLVAYFVVYLLRQHNVFASNRSLWNKV